MQGNPQSRAIINALQNNLNPIVEVRKSADSGSLIDVLESEDVPSVYRDKISYAIVTLAVAETSDAYSLAARPEGPFTPFILGVPIVLANREQINKFTFSVEGVISIVFYTNISF